MNKKLDQILRDSLDADVYNYIGDNFSSVKEHSIFELGIYSFDYMKLLVNIEENLNMDIDEFGSFNTFLDIERIIVNE